MVATHNTKLSTRTSNSNNSLHSPDGGVNSICSSDCPLRGSIVAAASSEGGGAMDMMARWLLTVVHTDQGLPYWKRSAAGSKLLSDMSYN